MAKKPSPIFVELGNILIELNILCRFNAAGFEDAKEEWA